jgi:hypothetical protein
VLNDSGVHDVEASQAREVYAASGTSSR